MGAPKGNQFWKIRLDMSESGRKRSPQDVLRLAQEYIDRCYKEKLYELDYKGKDATPVEIPHMIAMSVRGLCVHLGITRATWYQWRKDEKYLYICSYIEELMSAYNIEGAGAGMLNHSIIAKVVGLVEKTDVTSSDGSMSPSFEQMSNDELKQRIEALKKIKDLDNTTD